MTGCGRSCDRSAGLDPAALLALAHGAGQLAACVAELVRAIDELQSGLARGLGVALLRGARDVLERGSDIAHRRHEILPLVGEVLWRLQVLELLPQVAELLCEVVELLRKLPIRRALRGLDGVADLLSQGVMEANLYGRDEAVYGGLNAFFLLMDKPEAYRLPNAANATLPGRNNTGGLLTTAVTAVLGVLGGLIALRRRQVSPQEPPPSETPPTAEAGAR